MDKKFSIDVSQTKVTKRMVMYTAASGKAIMVPPYFSQEKLAETFGHLPTNLRITVEEIT